MIELQIVWNGAAWRDDRQLPFLSLQAQSWAPPAYVSTAPRRQKRSGILTAEQAIALLPATTDEVMQSTGKFRNSVDRILVRLRQEGRHERIPA